MVIVVYNMPRAARRTLESLSSTYQRNLPSVDYEVIVVDNGSEPALTDAEVTTYGPQFRLISIVNAPPSPLEAVRVGVESARGALVGVMLDGARMLSPGALAAMHRATMLSERSFVTVLAWHLGPDHQSRSITAGYDEAVEDELLDSIQWPSDGHRLFEIGSLESSNPAGWFGPIAESTCFVTPRSVYDALHGFDERFVGAGGGLANHDLFRRVAASNDVEIVVILGEGTFHQVHGGISTNSPVDRWPIFAAEYREVVGDEYSIPSIEATYVGVVGPSALRWIGAADDVARLTSAASRLAEHAASLQVQNDALHAALAAEVEQWSMRPTPLVVPGLVGANVPDGAEGLGGDGVIERLGRFTCVLLRDCEIIVVEGWSPEEVDGDRRLTVVVDGHPTQFSLGAGMFLVRVPFVAPAGSAVDVEFDAAWTFARAIVPERETRLPSWRLMGIRFDGHVSDYAAN